MEKSGATFDSIQLQLSCESDYSLPPPINMIIKIHHGKNDNRQKVFNCSQPSIDFQGLKLYTDYQVTLEMYTINNANSINCNITDLGTYRTSYYSLLVFILVSTFIGLTLILALIIISLSKLKKKYYLASISYIYP